MITADEQRVGVEASGPTIVVDRIAAVESVENDAATTDRIVQHMFSAALDLNVLLLTLDGQPAERVASAINELDLGIRLLRESFYGRAGLIDL